VSRGAGLRFRDNRAHSMAEGFYFICYSRQDGEDIALRLADQLLAGPPSIPVWIDRRDLQPGIDRYVQVVQALKECQGVVYLITHDSVNPGCPCTQEWIRALKYKKPVIPLTVHADAELPFRLEPREPIDCTDAPGAGLARLREHVRWRATPEGMLHTMNERLRDAVRDLVDAQENARVRIQEEIDQLQQQINALNVTIRNPQAARERTQKNIDRGLERERQPELPVAARIQTRFINRPPLIPPTYFQNRHVETGQIGSFLRNENMRLVTVVGRGGVGKTAMVCRLLRALESGRLPDDLGELAVDGIVYLSARSGHPVSFPNLFSDLCRLLPEEKAKYLDQLYKDPKQTSTAQMRALLAEFPGGRTVVLLDNFEDVVDAETQAIKEGELDEALRAVLDAPSHGLKFIITTRVAPQALLRVQPGLQDSLELDQGLKSPYAENVLRAMDPGGTLGLNAPDAPLAEAREATRGFPRALEAVVGILRTDRSTDLRGLLKELRQLSSKAEDVVRDLVGEAFNRLDPLAQEVMQALAVYGAPIPAVAIDYLLQPYRIGIDSSRTLMRLANMQFVRGEAGRFYLHQVDRDYALNRVVEGEPADRKLVPPPFTRYALFHRAAEYFKETRKPREDWKTLDDLLPQLAEFDLRLIGEDHVAATNVLLEIDDNYLSLWGHYRLLVDRYERLQGKLADPELEFANTVGLGAACSRTGQFERAIGCYTRALDLARAQNNKRLEASALTSLGWCYGDMGDQSKAIEINQQGLAAYQALGDKTGEATVRGNLANRLSDLGRSAEAIEQYQQSIALDRDAGNRAGECLNTYNLAALYGDVGDLGNARRLAGDARDKARAIVYRLIECAATSLLADLMVHEGRFEEAMRTYDEARVLADETHAVQMQMGVRKASAWACLLAGNVARARVSADEAAQYRFPNGYASVLALGGVVAVRQGNLAAAGKAFDLAIREADAQLAGLVRAYASLYSKALALAGLALCRDPAFAAEAARAYHDARLISADAGVIMDQKQKLGALAVADSAGILREVGAVLEQPRHENLSSILRGRLRGADVGQ
jgi:tetratricopeptide (TPR) repeat protein